MRPEALAGEWRVGVGAIPHEAAGGVRVHGEQERDEEVVGVVEGLERLLAHLRVRGRVHEKHAQQHDVAGDATGLRVVDLDSRLRAHLRALDVVEAVLLATVNRWRRLT
jgi:hypothetical protein